MYFIVDNCFVEYTVDLKVLRSSFIVVFVLPVWWVIFCVITSFSSGNMYSLNRVRSFQWRDVECVISIDLVDLVRPQPVKNKLLAFMRLYNWTEEPDVFSCQIVMRLSFLVVILFLSLLRLYDIVLSLSKVFVNPLEKFFFGFRCTTLSL